MWLVLSAWCVVRFCFVLCCVHFIVGRRAVPYCEPFHNDQAGPSVIFPIYSRFATATATATSTATATAVVVQAVSIDPTENHFEHLIYCPPGFFVVGPRVQPQPEPTTTSCVVLCMNEF